MITENYIQKIKELLENRQIIIYFAAVILALIIASLTPNTSVLEASINPALALMLYVTFLQVPLVEMKQAFKQVRFLFALLIANFFIVPVFVMLLVRLTVTDPMIQLGVLMVLLTPCIDYVITFSHLGRADARLLLVATPVLLVMQMLLLPFFLKLSLGVNAAHLIHPGPFIQAFIWLIFIPFILAALTQFWSENNLTGKRVSSILGLLPVPATAIVLFIVVAAVVPQLGQAIDEVVTVVPIFIAFAFVAPLLGWPVCKMFSLNVPSSRAIAFSTSTRNSLVVLPLALAIPGAIPVLPAIIITQTLVELISELLYVRIIPRLIK